MQNRVSSNQGGFLGFRKEGGFPELSGIERLRVDKRMGRIDERKGRLDIIIIIAVII